MTATPWMKFYPSDWRADPALRMCGLAARGLWMEMLALMHEATPRGSLIVNGKPVTSPMLASLTGATISEVETLTAQLEENGVFSRKKNGVIFSRRIERDENKARKNRENGKMGGNPTLCNNEKKEASDKAHGSIPESRSQKPEVEEGTNVPSVAGDEKQTFDTVLKSWNQLAADCGLSPINLLTTARKVSLRLRLREIGGLGGWSALMARIRAGPFLLGDNDKGWKCSFDWILKPANLTKIMEGNYDARKTPVKHSSYDRSAAVVTDAIDGRLASLRSEIAQAEGRPGISEQDTETLPGLCQVYP